MLACTNTSKKCSHFFKTKCRLQYMKNDYNAWKIRSRNDVIQLKRKYSINNEQSV